VAAAKICWQYSLPPVARVWSHTPKSPVPWVSEKKALIALPAKIDKEQVPAGHKVRGYTRLRCADLLMRSLIIPLTGTLTSMGIKI